MKKLALAFLGQALPSASALESYLAHARQAVMYSVIAAIMIGALLVAGLYGLHWLLVSEGLSNIASTCVTLAAALLITIICLQRAMAKSKHASEVTESLSPFEADSPSLIEVVATSFLEGVLKDDAAEQKTHPAKNSIVLVKE